MDILKILNDLSNELYLEDLEFFETELSTGEYDDEYVSKCKSKILQLKTWMKCKDLYENKNKLKKSKTGVMVDLANIVPENQENKPKTAEIIFKDIRRIRKEEFYKKKFKTYIEDRREIDKEFVEKNFAFFEKWEIDTIITMIQMGEEFLEKYFAAIDHDKIAKYQLFSESFYIKYFAQLDTKLVLEKGINEWRKKENRSKQLDVFLRLKGVKI